MVESKRKKGESFESFLRRFNKRLQQSGKLYEARERKYLLPKKNKTAKKRSALVGMQLRKNREYLKKTGKLKEEERKRW